MKKKKKSYLVNKQGDKIEAGNYRKQHKMEEYEHICSCECEHDEGR